MMPFFLTMPIRSVIPITPIAGDVALFESDIEARITQPLCQGIWFDGVHGHLVAQKHCRRRMAPSVCGKSVICSTRKSRPVRNALSEPRVRYPCDCEKDRRLRKT